MVKKSKEPPDDRQEEGQFIELPEDRLGQIEKGSPQDESAEKPKRKTPAKRKRKQTQVVEEAPDQGPEKPEQSREDLLADIRQTLIAEEEVEQPKGLFGRIRNRLKKPAESKEPGQGTDADLQAQLDALLESQEDAQNLVIKAKQKKSEPKKTKDEEIAIQEFFADLEALADIAPAEYEPPPPVVEESLPEPELAPEPVHLPKILKKSEEEEEDFESIRELALEEYDQSQIEVEERKAPLQEEVRETIRELKPLERMLLIGAGILTALVLLSSGVYLIVNSISIPTPTPTAEVDVADTIHPIQLTMPGGWEFSLGQGKVVEGEWSPKRAEWLVGTEISRWVALPWSLQLEAVLRTLKPEDQLELTMSNFDVLVYNVYSIRQLTMQQLLATDPKTPALLVVLYNSEETDGLYWVVEALPEGASQP